MITGALSVGADIGGTKTAAVLCDESGHVIACTWIEHDPAHDDPIEDRVLRAVEDVSKAVPAGAVRTLGVAVAGLISRDGRAIVHAATLGAQGIPLSDMIEARHTGRVTLVNDANATLLGHLEAEDTSVEHSTGRTGRSVVLLTLGTGLGGAIAVDGTIVDGAHGFAGELGHLTVDFDDPRRCLCGAPGCVENYASGRGLVELAAEAGVAVAVDGASYDSRRIISLAAENPDARTVVEHAGAMLGRALTQLSTALDPAEFLIGGSVGHAAAEIMLPAARAEMARRWPFSHVRPMPAVRVDSIGPYAAAVGAARTARLHSIPGSESPQPSDGSETP